MDDGERSRASEATTVRTVGTRYIFSTWYIVVVVQVSTLPDEDTATNGYRTPSYQVPIPTDRVYDVPVCCIYDTQKQHHSNFKL